ncbi:MAG TPA: hypothetical protein VN894_05640 [Polyangiaceae bacterium]|nr:hypothetical protein [Polyangiaceae bacterium]
MRTFERGQLRVHARNDVRMGGRLTSLGLPKADPDFRDDFRFARDVLLESLIGHFLRVAARRIGQCVKLSLKVWIDGQGHHLFLNNFIDYATNVLE